MGSCNGAFRQLDARTGKVQWETNVRRTAPKYFFHGDVFVTPDRIIASADVEPAAGLEAGLHAFDRSTGRELWMHPAGRGVPGAVIGAEKRVFAYTTSGQLIALSLESGKREWSHELKADGWESPGVLGQRVFAGSGEGVVLAFDAEKGRVEWQQKVGTTISTSLRAGDSAVYAGSGEGTMHRLSTQSGEVLASLKLDSTLKPSSAPLLRPDGVFVLLTDAGADYRALVSMDAALGRVKWRRQAPDRWSTTRVFATEKTIVLGTPTGDVTAYCMADGSPAWTHKLASAPIRSIGGTDQTLFIGTPQGTLYAVRPPRACM